MLLAPLCPPKFLRGSAAALLLVFCLSACGSQSASGSAEEADAEPEISYYHDIKPILDSHCVACHGPDGLRSDFPLTSYEEVLPVRDLVNWEVQDGTMPPWKASPDCNNYQDDHRLSDDQIAAFQAWVEADSPAGDPAKAVAGPAPPSGELSRVDLRLEMPEPYTPTGIPDDYRCFLIEWPEDELRYVSGFRAVPGNNQVVHHVIAFLIPPGKGDVYRDYDADEEGPGYTCFGGPGALGADTDIGAEWLGGWAPGGQANENNGELGIPVQPGSLVVLQVHYNLRGPVETPDQSAIEMRIEDEVGEVATIMPWTNPDWVMRSNMPIPARDRQVSHGFAFDPTTFFGGDGFTIRAASLHMHLLGRKARASIQRQAGEEDCLLEIPDWDFNWQRMYSLETPVDFHAGDKLALECEWDNSPDNQPIIEGQRQPSRSVNWGDGSFDEMCLAVFYVTGLQ